MSGEITLASLGFRVNWVYEALIETELWDGGGLHIRPVGVYSTDLDKICVSMYRNRCYRNLLNNPEASIYLPEDSIDLCITERDEAENKCRARIDVLLEHIGPEHNGCDKLTFQISNINKFRDREINKPINRAQCLFLEYLIDESRRTLSPGYAERTGHYRRVIDKVAPESVYSKHITAGDESCGVMHEVEVVAPSRLHFGLIDLNGSLGRVDGSAGVSISSPFTDIVVKRTDKSGVSIKGGAGYDRKRASGFAKKLSSALHIEEGVDIHLKSILPPHVGLGSTTSMGMCIGAGINALFSCGVDNGGVARILGRGGTSGVGVAGFDAGGFIVDGGHDFRRKGGCFLPSDYSDIEPPQVVSRCCLPPNWFFVCALPKHPRMCAEREMDFFREKCPIDYGETNLLSRIILLKLIPSAMEGDIKTFGEAITQMQDIGFKRYEVERLGNGIHELMDYMTRKSWGAGVSSFGPLVFGIVDTYMDALILKEKTARVAEDIGIEVEKIFISNTDNEGAKILRRHQDNK